MENTKNLFDPIDFLGLQLLHHEQKRRLRQPILADMAKYILDIFVAELNEAQVDDFLKRFEPIANNPLAITQLMEGVSPGFDKRKMVILDNYRQSFKLQNFQTYL